MSVSPQRRALLVGGSAPRPPRLKVRDHGQVMVEICDELEEVVSASLAGAPFATISIILRYVDGSSDAIEIGRINKRHAELEVDVNIPLSDLRPLDRDQLKLVFREQVIRALRVVGEKYGLPIARNLVPQ